jgi:hypothetical protein
MHINGVAIAILSAVLAGCVPMPPTSTEYGSGYAPCVPRAVDNGMCPKEGWRRPPQQ